MMNYLKKSLKKSERGQAIILIAFAMVALAAMVGLVVDTGILLINYGKLKRGVDAAAIAAAQQYRAAASSSNIDAAALENSARNFLQLNQAEDVKTVDIHSCDALDPARPALCNPLNGPSMDNRKLVEVTATADVYFSFLSVIGIRSTTISVTSIGEAATIDLVLVIDTSASMAYETSGGLNSSDPGDDPSVCNNADNCMPMREVKNVASDFVDTLYLPYDRVSIITMTRQTEDGLRTPTEVLPLTSTLTTVQTAINGIQVFEPRVCDDASTISSGACRKYNGGTFANIQCEFYQLTLDPNHPDHANSDPSACPSSNVGGALALARYALTGSGDADKQRLDAFWVVIALLGGPANATDPIGFYPNGVCPKNTWWPLDPPISGKSQPWCRDMEPSVRHQASDPLVPFTNPISNDNEMISLYDADDYARDMADNLATTTTGTGVTIYAIGLGNQVTSTTTVLDGEEPSGEALLKYIATCAGEDRLDDCSSLDENDYVINHGQYFNATVSAELSGIFNQIANNIATKISQ
jgi:hypothetical protein